MELIDSIINCSCTRYAWDVNVVHVLAHLSYTWLDINHHSQRLSAILHHCITCVMWGVDFWKNLRWFINNWFVLGVWCCFGDVCSIRQLTISNPVCVC